MRPRDADRSPAAFAARAGRLLGLAAFALALAGAASGARAQAIGYMLDSSPTAKGTIHPLAAYAFSSASTSSVSITHNSLGSYRVTFLGLGNGLDSNVQINAVGSSDYCMSVDWASTNGKDVAIDVLCFNVTGGRADSRFALLYQARTSWHASGSALSFVWANDPMDGLYSPSPFFSFNSTARQNEIMRNQKGDYTVYLPRVFQSGPGGVQVTGHGATPARCVAEDVAEAGQGDGYVSVGCIGVDGAAIDSSFNLLVFENVVPGVGALTFEGAYALYDKPDETAFNEPAVQFNQMSSGKLFGRRTGPGAYLVVVPGHPSYRSSIALVTALVVAAPNFCNPAGWNAQSEIAVRCYSSSGVPTDSEFELAYQVSPYK